MFKRWGLIVRLAIIAALLVGAGAVVGARGANPVQAASPAGGSVFTPIAPQRLVDTRIGLGAPQQRLQPATSLTVQVTGFLGVPSNATAVVANVTAVDASGPGYLQVLPTGQAAFGSSSTLNIDSPGQTIPNATFAPLGDNGQLTIYTIFATDVVVDISGFFTPAGSSSAGRLVPVTPNRILDTRIGLGWTPPAPPPAPVPTTNPPVSTPAPPQPANPPGNPGNSKNCDDFATYQEAKTWFDSYYPYYGDVANLDSDGDLIPCETLPGRTNNFTGRVTESVAAATVITLQVAGRGGVPSTGVSAVVMNVTAVDPAGPGFVQVAPTPVVAGASSNLNTAAGRTIANLVVVPLGPAGTVDLYLTTPADLVADVVGYFTDSSAANSSVGLFVPVTPNRQLDTRQTSTAPLGGGTVTRVDTSDISPTAIAIAGNLTATEAVQVGYLQLAAVPISVGASSNLNVAYIRQTIANAVVSPVAGGQLDLFNQNPTHALLDMTGWFTSGPYTPPVATTTTLVESEPPPPPTTTPVTTTAPATTTTQPTPTGPDGKIAFTRANQIYTINPNGTGETKLTTGDKNYMPRWSPDGDRIAYVHEVGGVRNIWVMNANGTNKQQATFEGTSGGADWSPDGLRLAYAGRLQSGDNVLKHTPSTAPFGSPQVFPMVTDLQMFGSPDWSPSGQDIAIQAFHPENNPTFLYSYNLASTDLIGYENFDPSDGSFSMARFSSDGSLLTYSVTLANNDGGTDPPTIRMKRVADQQQVSGFASIAEDADLVFAPSGAQVALMNDAGGSPTIYIASANGSSRRTLTVGYLPDWQRLP